MVEVLRKQLILAKSETTYRTDPTPTAGANSILAEDIVITEQAPPVSRAGQPGTMSKLPALLGERFVEITFKVRAKGSGSAGTAPNQGALLLACGMDETIVSNTSVTYEPVSSSISSCTIWLYVGGRVHKITGCYGTLKGVCMAGQEMMYEFAFMAYRASAPAVAAIPTPTFDSTTGICKGGTLSYNSKTTLIGKLLDFDLANSIAKRMDLADSNAIQGFEIVDRTPIASFDPETDVQTSYDFRGDVLTNQRELSYAVGSILTVTIPKFNPFEPVYEEDEGILRDKISGEMAQDTGDDEIAIAYIG